ncbi:hypothetical protein MAPG_06824 [Magnaporthiopsis poae ATCC 64411]|uniref:Uncharacterized protein n=1 Tax=Magnaporthiopsis poae (strain ATCC 64411 / 73-15) TaxID=644358 RepID=A0A0C4E332_MAGP6|nr:hypothetical protein MAPG_06824 [Magnaporthiopsis poae ATCC 64411]
MGAARSIAATGLAIVREAAISSAPDLGPPTEPSRQERPGGGWLGGCGSHKAAAEGLWAACRDATARESQACQVRDSGQAGGGAEAIARMSDQDAFLG